MRCHSKKIPLSALARSKGFGLPEVVTALMILAFIGSSVLVVISRCVASAADSSLRIRAFEVARDNMEKLLASNSAQEMVEYGISDKYPEIQWQTVVEAFYEPVTSRMWVKAVCSAEYADSAGEAQTVELTHWLTNLTKEQLLKIVEEKQKEKERLAEADQLVEGAEGAAAYLGVDAETIQQWVVGGMPMTDDGDYIKAYLDLYEGYDGNPPIEARREVDQVYVDVGGRIGGRGELSKGSPSDTMPLRRKPGDKTPSGKAPVHKEPSEQPTVSDAELICGYTMAELSQMPFEQLWGIVLNCDEF
jgi:Tfp pilus assembly protein PilV